MYNPKKIEAKWQEYWDKNQTFKTDDSSDKEKFYVLDMFPYPSGAGLHVGHPKGYIATDIIARMKMMQGYNVLHPMGWDAFGLPAENYAIKNKVHPVIAVEKNINTFKNQLGLLGFTYDWSREVNTTDPQYYKWTQWIFLQMFKRGLAYESNEPINWCPMCQTGLANEDLEGGKCERCGSEIERKPMRQWVLKITEYADRLLQDLEKLSQWPESIKTMQKDWIGKSSGAIIKFKVNDYQENKDIQNTKDTISGKSDYSLEVFTTRPDTLFGCTYMVVAPEHKVIKNYKSKIKNYEKVQKYIKKAKTKSDLERTELQPEKTGVELTGIKAINPVNNEKIPIFVADYVLGNYGTGAIMAVPAHDEKDWEFAKKYNLKIRPVVLSGGGSTTAGNDENQIIQKELNKIINNQAFIDEGYNINSNFLSGLKTSIAKIKIIEWIEKRGIGKKQIQYKLRDWVFSRQRYWGEPIPLVKCDSCGWVPIPEDQLPLELPKVKNYEPSGTGESPLANIDEWVNTNCPKCGGLAKRETNTMPQWAGSCWYYLAYCISDGKSKTGDKKYVWDKDKINYWNPVNVYVGGAEHATRHLIYARFWHKFLYDIGAVDNEEPFTKLQNVGLILAEDGRKMSKRWNNVINPNEVVNEFGADSIRLYEMFMGPFNQSCAWSTKGVVGMRRFLDKVWKLQNRIVSLNEVKNIYDKNEILLHQTIKKVTEDIDRMHFNTAIAQMMSWVNRLSKYKHISKKEFSILVKLLSPFAPHLCEELWFLLDNKESIVLASWPNYDESKTVEDKIILAIQVNGKLRDTMEVSSDISENKAKEIALQTDKIKQYTEGNKIKKVIYVKGKLVSIVV